MPPLVLYHANCWDGFCAAWVARQALGDIEAIPVQYGQSPPDVAGREVWVLDFSYPRAALVQMHREAASLLVLDHHATAGEALAGLDFCVFDLSKSGARLAWEHWFPGTGAPWLVDYTEDRDLWRHALPSSQEVNAALRSYPLDFATWDGLARENIVALAADGAAIRRMERQLVETHVRNARVRTVCGINVLAVNATVLFSEIAHELARGRPFGACYFDRADGKRQWSLRSTTEGMDVAALAKAMGGGGHRHAAGFEEPL